MGIKIEFGGQVCYRDVDFSNTDRGVEEDIWWWSGERDIGRSGGCIIGEVFGVGVDVKVVTYVAVAGGEGGGDECKHENERGED